MKIIGKTKEGYILEASSTDLANLVGHYYEGDVKRAPDQSHYGGNTGFKIGDVINVHAMYDQLNFLARERKQCERTALELENLAARLRLVDPMIRASAGEEKANG